MIVSVGVDCGLQQIEEQRLIVQTGMLYPKTLKSINGLKTHKIIREELMKQDFFEHLFKQIKLDLSSQEHEFLLNYLLAERHQTKQEKTNLNTQTNINLTQKQNLSHLNQLDTGLYQTPRNISSKRNLTACQRVRGRPKQKKHKYRTFQKSIYQNCLTDDNFYRNSLVRCESNGPKLQGHKFRKLQMTPKRQKYTEKSTKAPNRESGASRDTGLSHEYLRRNYKQAFIKDIFERHTFQQKDMEVDSQFKDTYSFINSEDINAQQQRQENKYKYLTSIGFQRSPRSRFRCKVNTRKF